MSIVASTVADTPMPMPPIQPMPTRRRPSIEIITVVPAKTTARPAESMAATVASRGRAALVQALPVAGDDEQARSRSRRRGRSSSRAGSCRRGW